MKITEDAKRKAEKKRETKNPRKKNNNKNVGIKRLHMVNVAAELMNCANALPWSRSYDRSNDRKSNYQQKIANSYSMFSCSGLLQSSPNTPIPYWKWQRQTYLPYPLNAMCHMLQNEKKNKKVFSFSVRTENDHVCPLTRMCEFTAFFENFFLLFFWDET